MNENIEKKTNPLSWLTPLTSLFSDWFSMCRCPFNLIPKTKKIKFLRIQSTEIRGSTDQIHVWVETLELSTTDSSSTSQNSRK